MPGMAESERVTGPLRDLCIAPVHVNINSMEPVGSGPLQ